MDLNSQTVGIVVPTLGQRNNFLKDAIFSIKASSNVYICVVCPDVADLGSLADLIDQRVTDPSEGLASAINYAFSKLPSEIELINWLGDDDFLEPQALDVARSALIHDAGVSAVFGRCAYVDDSGSELFVNRSGRWAIPLLHFGPDLIPQPGMLFRRSAFNLVGGLNPKYQLAFDLDLILKLKTIGKIKYLNKKVANFRWHPDSLSVGQREQSVSEASMVRVSHLPKNAKPFAQLWEFPVKFATLITGKYLSRILRKE